MIKEGPNWDLDVVPPKYPEFPGKVEADIVIIGGGMTGLLSAYLLRDSGKKIVVLEKNKVGWGATGVTTAFLTGSLDTKISKLTKMYGKEKTSLIFESHKEAIDFVEKIVKEEKIDCEFMRVSNFTYASDEKEAEELKEEERAAKEVGLDLKYKNDNVLGFKNSGYLELRNQAKFHPLKYLYAISEILLRAGVAIYENIEVAEVVKKKSGYILKSKEGDIRAGKVIMATYAPINKKLYFKKAFYDSYVFEAEIPIGKIHEGIYEDSRDPYHYFRVDKREGKDRIIIGGEDHRSDIKVKPEKNFRALVDYTNELLHSIPFTILRKWSGPIIESVDGLAYVGALKDKNIFYATGFSGNGMTYSHIAAKIIADAISGKKNKYAGIYDAKRKPTLKQLAHKGADYTRILAHGAIKNTLKYRKKKN